MMTKRPRTDTVNAQDKAEAQGRPIPRNEDAKVNQHVRPDPQPKDDTLPSTGTIPAHEPNDIEGVIQEKKSPDAPITERLPNESDLEKGRITPLAVNKPDPNELEASRYERGVTQEDIDQGRVSPSAVRQRAGWEHSDKARDERLGEMIKYARDTTQLSRLTHDELLTAFRTLDENGYGFQKRNGTGVRAGGRAA